METFRDGRKEKQRERTIWRSKIRHGEVKMGEVRREVRRVLSG